MSALRINPLSFIRGREFVFQYGQEHHVLRLSGNLWKTLRAFYRLPTLAPAPRMGDGDGLDLLIKIGILVNEDSLTAFLRRERRVLWLGDDTAIHYLLAASDLGADFWFEFNGRCPLLFFGWRGGASTAEYQICTYDGTSFSFERYGASMLAKNKAATHTLLCNAGCAVPSQIAIERSIIPNRSTKRMKQRLLSEVLQYPPAGFGFPAVLKPGTGSLGKGVRFVTCASDLATQLVRMARAMQDVPYFVVETKLTGREWRIAVVADGSHAAYERLAFAVTGDGISTVRDLIRDQNRRRRELAVSRAFVRQPSRLRIDYDASRMMKFHDVTLDTTLERDRRLILSERPMAANGASFRDATHLVPSGLVASLQRIRTSMGLARAGFDVMGPALESDIRIIEVNSRPHLWAHSEPDEGEPQHLVRAMLHLARSAPLDGTALQRVSDACRLARAATYRA